MFGRRLSAHSPKLWIRASIFIVVSLLLLQGLIMIFSPAAQAATNVGYADFSYGTTGDTKPTGEKPESKLWWNDGYWWGSLYNDAAQAYHIYRLDLTNQTWVDTGTELDDRNTSRADVLWDGAKQKLYVASHIFSASGVATTDASLWGRVYRYTYTPRPNTYGTYALDSGFPVNVTRGKSETLVLDKDSTGHLWVAYVESNKVRVNHSVGPDNNLETDKTWGTPYILPVTGASGTSSDDIASLIAFDGRIGVMWSNQADKKMYFAVHVDGAADSQWQATSAYSPPGAGADDHINLKTLQTDGNGHVFAVTKTSFTVSTDPIMVLLSCSIDTSACTSLTDWQAATVNTVGEGGTRPILLVDTTNQQLNVFFTSSETGGPIMRKVSPISPIKFPTGGGTPFIQNSTYAFTNNATSTKQNVNSTTGLVVLASHASKHFYLHNYLSLGTTTATPTATTAPANTPTVTNTPIQVPANTPTPTATSTPVPGGGSVLSIAAAADTQVKTAFPTSNYGTVTNLRINNAPINSFLKFNVSGLTGTVQRATLRLYTYDGSNDGGSVFLVSNNYKGTTTPWTETGLTWNNAPALGTAPIGAAGSVADNTWVEIDVTAAIQGNGIYSFGMSSTSSNSVYYNSREETTNQPVLVIETS